MTVSDRDSDYTCHSSQFETGASHCKDRSTVPKDMKRRLMSLLNSWKLHWTYCGLIHVSLQFCRQSLASILQAQIPASLLYRTSTFPADKQLHRYTRRCHLFDFSCHHSRFAGVGPLELQSTTLEPFAAQTQIRVLCPRNSQRR